MQTTTSRPASGTATALRALADHLEQHQLDVLTARCAWGTLEAHLTDNGNDKIAVLLRGFDTLDAASITAETYEANVHLHAHGLIDQRRAEFVVVVTGEVADLLRTIFTLTDKQTAIPVHKLRALTAPALVTAAIHRTDEQPGGAR